MFFRFLYGPMLIMALSIRSQDAIAMGPCVVGSADTVVNEQFDRNDSDELIYIQYSGKRRIKSLGKSVQIIEVYKLPFRIVARLLRLQKPSRGYSSRLVNKQKELLEKWQDSCTVYQVLQPLKYKYFYPKGLRKGDYLTMNEFQRWDFCEVYNHGSSFVSELISEDNQPDTVSNSVHEVLSNANQPTEILSIVNLNTIVFKPWDLDGLEHIHKSYDPSFDHYFDSLFRHIMKDSSFLGVQRIRIELYDQPLASMFYSTMYMHFVDSIAGILKDEYDIKPGEDIKLIKSLSGIIPVRFTYGVNSFLWKGICRDRLDCDNTAFLAYDIGKKLGFTVNIVVVDGHALATVGEYAYETTNTEYYPQENLNVKYRNIYLNTSDTKKINAQLSCWEPAYKLMEEEDYEKARVFLETGISILPNNPLLMTGLGDVFAHQKKNEKALECYLTASQVMKDNLDLIVKINEQKLSIVRRKR